MGNTTLRLGRDTRISVTPDGAIGIEQGAYIDTDPDYRRDYVELRPDDVRRLVDIWLAVLIAKETS